MIWTDEQDTVFTRISKTEKLHQKSATYELNAGCRTVDFDTRGSRVLWIQIAAQVTMVDDHKIFFHPSAPLCSADITESSRCP